MKTRNGFISNSSSTSFIIAFNNDDMDENRKQFELLAEFICGEGSLNKIFSEKDLYAFRCTAGDRVEALQEEVKTVEQTREVLKKIVGDIEEKIKDPNVLAVVNECLQCFSDLFRLRYMRVMEKEEVSSTVHEKLGWLNRDVASYNEKISELSKDILMLNKLKGDTKIYGFEVDHMSRIRELVQKMEEKGMLTVIKKENT